MAPEAGEHANHLMVDALIAQGALWSPALIAAFRATPRHRFLDRIFQYQRKQRRWREILTRDPGEEELRLLYADRALITHLRPDGRRDEPGVPVSSSSQPSLMAQMLEDLRSESGQRVLEVGAGTGYNAALLAHVVGPEGVLSVDVDRGVLAEAWDHLRAFPERCVRLVHADGRLGYRDKAPFDRIMVTAATPDVEPAWLEQLANGGRLVAPLALAPGLAFVVRGTVTAGVFDGRLTRPAYFMPLRDERQRGDSSTEEAHSFGPLRQLPAPWAACMDRRRHRFRWLAFSQSLAFYGLLRGMDVFYQVMPDHQAAFGVSDAERSCVCWFGAQNWYVNSGAGRELGWALWRAFLDAGRPWPTEFRLRADPGGALGIGEGRETYLRQGFRCQQLWELMEPRDRGAER
jgi:protein-L-isoaspartate(D-aspartate) O-methyltransferase